MQNPIISVIKLNGYAMAFHINNMKRFQFDSHHQLLFDPKHINVRNEDDLAKRMAGLGGRTGVHTAALCITSKDSPFLPGAKGETPRRATRFWTT